VASGGAAAEFIRFSGLASFCPFRRSPDEGAERRNPGLASPHSASLHAGYKQRPRKRNARAETIGVSSLASFRPFARADGGAHRKDRRVERADGALAAREGAALVAVEMREPHERAGIARIGVERGEQRELGAAHPVEIDHCLGDPAGESVAGRIGRVADQRRLDAAGERDDLRRKRGVGEHRQGEAVPARVVCGGRLAGGRSRAGRAQRIAPVGADLRGTGQCGSSQRAR
jgi:hypothetical protein